MSDDRFTRAYSQRLGMLTGAQLQQALDLFDLGVLQAAEPAQAGLFGQNVFLDTDRGRFVLRACPHGHEQFPREQFFANQLHDRTAVPAPWPYRHEPEAEILPYGFAIMPRMPGVCLGIDNRILTLPPADRVALAAAHGRMLAQMHGLTWPIEGEYQYFSGTIQPMRPEFAPEVQLQCQVDRLPTLAVKATAAETAQIEATLAAARPALQTPFVPTYVHHDFREGNTTVTQGADGSWTVTGVFDLMEGYFRRPEEDFARYINVTAGDCPSAIKAFLDGYRATRELRDGWQARTRLFALRDVLTFWIYGQEHGWVQPDARLAPRLATVLKVPLE